MTVNGHVYFKGGDGKKADIRYKHITAIKAGTARQILGDDDARGNGLPLNAPLLQLVFDDGETATFDADNVTILF